MPGVAARVMLGLVFLFAGALKARNPSWPAMARSFGTPRPLVPVLPWTEIALGALLAAQVGVPWTSLVALLLLAAFTAAVGLQLRRGERRPCACFGAVSAAPAGRSTLIRNAVFMAVALLGLT